MSFGLCLSGGGSRAMAFHAGTLEGLSDCALLEEVKEVSSVSGGSIFAAAWAASIRSKAASLPQFLTRVRREVEQGFEGRAFLHPRILKTALPGVSRTDLLASTFERLFCPEMTLKDLPLDPSFFFNTAVMNHGQIGRFSRAGFTSTGLLPPGQPFGQGQPFPMPEFPVARAATASAAFPGLLPPLRIPRDRNHVPPGWGASAGIGARDELALADGGVLENLGIEAFPSGFGGGQRRPISFPQSTAFLCAVGPGLGPPAAGDLPLAHGRTGGSKRHELGERAPPRVECGTHHGVPKRSGRGLCPGESLLWADVLPSFADGDRKDPHEVQGHLQ